MRMNFTILLLCGLFACNQKQDNTLVWKQQLDSLRNRIDSAYAPGLGEFMSDIQVHHAKLWFAGKNGNWELANFEIGEIRESIDAIQKYCTDRPEIKELPMIHNPMDSLITSITDKNTDAFKRSFSRLTVTCNNCHQVTKHAFNVIKIPDTPPFTNQVFEKP